jgi:4'-phosphopantetheinyl transferase
MSVSTTNRLSMEFRAGEKTVDVWSVSLEPPTPVQAHLAGYLSFDERGRAERFVFARDRARFVAGRAFLRLLLGRYLAAEPRALQLCYGPNGKPSLADDRSGLRFNLAHSGALGVCALAWGSEVGVDLERLRPIRDAEGVARKAFSPREIARLESLPEPARLRAFYETWTRKEAVLKALGHGLARPLDSFDVSPGPNEPPPLPRTGGDSAEAHLFSFHALEPEDGYVGAVAVPGDGWQVRSARWVWDERCPSQVPRGIHQNAPSSDQVINAPEPGEGESNHGGGGADGDPPRADQARVRRSLPGR